MKHIKTAKKRNKFNLLTHTREAQAAMMTLKSGGTSDEEPSNEHSSSEQWLYVISGSGEVKIGKRRGQLRRIKLGTGSLFIIEKGELHQIINTGTQPLRSINFYIPPAYDSEGEPVGRLRQMLGAVH
jgi:mannose-6-phosphate isomerase-like protein (cupin superfamily)